MRKRAQITITLPPDLEKWIDERIERHIFANKSHAIEYCVARCRELEDKKCRDQDK